MTTSTSMAVHYSSARTDWATPWPLFRAIEAEYGPFDLDPCATFANTKCARYFTPEQDGLAQVWSGRVWLNPPYGRDIGEWVAKAAVTAGNGLGTVVALLPARTDTAWWHLWVKPRASEIVYLKGRIRFEGAAHSAPFPSAIVVWRRRGWADPTGVAAAGGAQ